MIRRLFQRRAMGTRYVLWSPPYWMVLEWWGRLFLWPFNCLMRFLQWCDDMREREVIVSRPDDGDAPGGYGCTAEPYRDWPDAGSSQ